MSPGDAGILDDNFRWLVRYRVSAVKYAAESSVDIDVPISNDGVQHIGNPQMLQSSPSCKFQFPMTFGSDLQDVVVLHTIIRPCQAFGTLLGRTCPTIRLPKDRLFTYRDIDIIVFMPRGRVHHLVQDLAVASMMFPGCSETLR